MLSRVTLCVGDLCIFLFLSKCVVALFTVMLIETKEMQQFAS